MINLKKKVRDGILENGVLVDRVNKDITLKVQFEIQMPLALKTRVGMRRHVFRQLNSHDLGL